MGEGGGDGVRRRGWGRKWWDGGEGEWTGADVSRAGADTVGCCRGDAVVPPLKQPPRALTDTFHDFYIPSELSAELPPRSAASAPAAQLPSWGCVWADGAVSCGGRGIQTATAEGSTRAARGGGATPAGGRSGGCSLSVSGPHRDVGSPMSSGDAGPTKCRAQYRGEHRDRECTGDDKA